MSEGIKIVSGHLKRTAAISSNVSYFYFCISFYSCRVLVACLPEILPQGIF